MDVKLGPGHHVHVHSHGEGAPTLCLHGWAVSSSLWDPVFERWPADHGRLLAMDLRGTGWSAKPREGYALEDYVRDVVGVIDALDLKDLALVGHSMGGTIAMRVALERPERLARLVLVSPVPATGVPLEEKDLGYFRSLGGTRDGATQILGMMLSKKPAPEAFERLLRGSATVALEAYLGGLDAWRTASFQDRIGGIKTPTTVLGGELEQPMNPAMLKQLVADAIPGARFEVLPGVGHYPQWEDPEGFMAKLLPAVRGAHKA